MSSFISNKSVTNHVLHSYCHNEDDNFLTLIDKIHNHTIHVYYLKVDVGSMELQLEVGSMELQFYWI